MDYFHLDHRTRALMVEEIQGDISRDKLYRSKRLNGDGLAAWPKALIEAARVGTPRELREKMLPYFTAFFETHPYGGRRMPSEATTMLCYNEFNRFYMRAVCRLAINNSIRKVVIYRAKVVPNPAPESEAMRGKVRTAAGLLNHLRSNTFSADTKFGRLGLGSSGLSVRLPPKEPSEVSSDQVGSSAAE